jgi:plastocyanin
VRTHRKSWGYAVAGWALVLVFTSVCPVRAEQNTVTARVEIKRKNDVKQEKTAKSRVDASNVVIWLKPLERRGAENSGPEQTRKRMQIVQRNKSFQPHLLVVPAGSVVDFPNRDPFFHNVFSLFDGKRFDLGLYEAGATNSVHFDRVGISFLFCNIHPEMSAVVVAVGTPYYGVTDRAGKLMIENVPDGRYEVQVWYERGIAEDLKVLTREVTISATSKDLGTIDVPENPSFSLAHKNKYGQDYAPPPAQGYSSHP